MRTLDFHPCKVCKDFKNTNVVPIPKLNPETSEIETIECLDLESLDKDQKTQFGLDLKDVLLNCDTTALENNKVICYKCEEEFFYDGSSQKCRRSDEYSTMENCSLTFDNVHCQFCHRDTQMDFTSGKCISKKHKIEFNKLDTGMGPQFEQENLAVNQRHQDIQGRMFDSGNSFSDDSYEDYTQGEYEPNE